jgi:hypothetical protein
MYVCTLCEKKFDQIPADAELLKLRYGVLYRFKDSGVSTVHSLREIRKDEKEQERCH